MIGVKPYDTLSFNATPDLPQALAKHARFGGDDKIGIFGPVFAKHKVEKLIGLTLIHHHFDLEHGEYLTEVAGTSTAWKSTTGTIPHVWTIDYAENALVPLEFVMMDNPAPIDWNSPTMQEFLGEFINLSQETESEGVYGLTTYPGDDFPGRVEMTVGRANVNLTPTQAATHDPANQSQATWYFADGIVKHGCSCNCFHHGTKNSSHTHITTRSG